ncbi:DUF4340 domain-containing protein [candidate division KSB1 bacterium]|nr:DUF4340 domain-containing protein [candidate division KSB1 bacterium]
MNFKRNLVLALIFVVGVAAVYFLQKQDKKKEEAKEADEKLLVLEKDDVSELFLQPSGIHAVKDSTEWKILQPVVTDGEKSSIDALVNMFDWAKIDRIISSDPAQYADFGLQPERGRMVVVRETRSDTIWLGDKNPTGSFVFGRRSGSPDVFTCTSSLESNIQKTLFDLRNKDVLSFDKNQVKSLKLSVGKQVFDLEKQAGKWQLLSPKQTEADESKVNTILDRLNSENAREFVDEDPSDLGKYGLNNPTVQVELIQGENRLQKSLLVGAEDGDKYYAMDKSRKPVFKVDSSFVGVLETTLFDLRNKKLADFIGSDIDHIELAYSGNTFMFEKDTSGTWLVIQPEPREAKSWKMSSLTAALANMRVKEFVSDTPSSLGKYGLETPEVVGKFTQDGLPLMELHLGKTVDDLVYAKIAGQDPVYKVDKDILDKLTPELDDIAEPAPETADSTANENSN